MSDVSSTLQQGFVDFVLVKISLPRKVLSCRSLSKLLKKDFKISPPRVPNQNNIYPQAKLNQNTMSTDLTEQTSRKSKSKSASMNKIQCQKLKYNE